MSLFDNLGGQQMNPMAMLQQLQQNPAALLQKAGYSIPAGVTNPQQIVNHLMQTGQITNSKLAQAQQMAQRFR